MSIDWINVSSTAPRIAYVATSLQTVFTVPFVFFASADLFVYQNTTLLTLATHYTVSGAEDEDGGTITLLTGATVGDEIMIVRDLEIVQTTHIPPSGPLDIPAINVQFSKLIAIDQQLDDALNRAIHFPDSDSTLSGELASVATRKNTLVGFDTDGELIYPLGPTFVGDTATGVAIVDSRSTAQVTTFDVSVNVVRTEGLVTPGDGGGAEYVRGLVGDPGAFQDGGGVYWKFASIVGAVVEIDSRASAVTARFAANVNIVVTNGYATSGDGGGARYKRGIISSPGAFQDASGVYWGLDLSAGIAMASWFGAVGDDATNDYTALQAGITAAVTAGIEFHLNPGKKYYVSGADLLIQIPSGCKNFNFYGNGASIRTNSAQARTALKVQHVTAVTRLDQNRKVLISGVTIEHTSDPTALCGIEVISSPHTTIRDCSFNAGSDSGVPNQGSYAGIKFTQSILTNPDYGAFWCRVQNCDFIGGASSMPICVWISGGHNALILEGNTFSICNIAVQCTAPTTVSNPANPTTSANESVLVNGLRVINNDFEGCTIGVYGQGNTGFSKCEGWIVAHNRIESISNSFFNVAIIDLASLVAPILGPNYLDSGSWGKYISIGGGVKIDVRDEYVGTVTGNPNNYATGVTAIDRTLTVTPAAVGDTVVVHSNLDLLGIIATGFVSSANTVSIRLVNGTSAAIDLPSIIFTVRVRPRYL